MKVFVTGGTGFLGRSLVRRLLADGHHVRVLARKVSKVETLRELGVELCFGDVADMESFETALADCDVVAHLAAGTSGSARDSQTATLQGTRNILELCRRHRPKRLVYISSCSVYGVADYARGAVVTENAALERFPERRGHYSSSKRVAETYVSEFMKSSGVPTVILRPGTIYGPGGDLYTPVLGFSTKSLYVVIGRGSFALPFVYVDCLVDAIIKCIEKDEAVGQVFNVVDQEKLTKRAYMDGVIRRVDQNARVVYLPYSVLYAITWLQEHACALMRMQPFLSCYRLRSSQRNVVYDSSAIRRRLNWISTVPLSQAMEQVVSWELPKGRSASRGAPAKEAVQSR